jgi:hypothetical protein
LIEEVGLCAARFRLRSLNYTGQVGGQPSLGRQASEGSLQVSAKKCPA